MGFKMTIEIILKWLGIILNITQIIVQILIHKSNIHKETTHDDANRKGKNT